MTESVTLSDRQVLAMSIILQETLLDTSTAIKILHNPRPRLKQLGLSKEDIEKCIKYGDVLWDIITADDVRKAWVIEAGRAITVEPELTNRQVFAMNLIWQESILDLDAGSRVLTHPKERLEELGIKGDDLTNVLDYVAYVFEELLKRSMEAWQEDYEDEDVPNNPQGHSKK